MKARIEELERLLHNESAEIRRQAVLSLGGLGEADRVSPLLEALGDVDWRVRKEAAGLMAESAREESVIRALIEATEDDENIGRRNAALEALARTGGPAIDLVIARTTHPVPDARKTALDIIGLSRDPRAVSLLRDTLSDTDTIVQTTAAEWLGEYPGNEAEEALISCLGSRNSLLQLVALQSLDRIAASVSFEHLAPLRNNPLLTEALIPLLGASRAPAAVPEVIRRLRDLPGACVALEALHDVGEELAGLVEAQLGACGPDLQDALWRFLDDSDPEVQRAALRCIIWMKQPASMPRIIPLVRNSRFYPVLVTELSRWGGPAIDVLSDMLETESNHGLASVIGLLYRLLDEENGRESAKAFEGLLTSEHPAVATAAASAVARFGDTTAVSRLLHLIKSDSDRVRNAAGAALLELAEKYPEEIRLAVRGEVVQDKAGVQLCRVLAAVGGEEASGAVGKALASPDPELRRCAVKALAKLAGEAAIPDVVGVLIDPDLSVRMAAVDALAGIGAPAAGAIASALETARGPVASALVRAIGKVGHPDAVSILSEACLRSSDLVQAALEAADRLGVGLEALPESLLEHPDKEVIKAVLRLFGGEVALERRVALLSHTEWDVRLSAVTGLALSRDAGGSLRHALRRRLGQEENDLVRSAIVEVLERSGEGE